MPLTIANRMQLIQPFHVMDLLARARAMEAEGRSVIHMEVGEPDFPTPEPIQAAGRAALAADQTKYTAAAGILELRRAIAAHYRERFDLDLDPARILITPGSSGALQLVMSSLINPGEQVLLADPGYPCNRHFVRLVEGDPVALAVTAADNYQPNPRAVADAWGDATRALMLASPSNPTGTLVSREQMTELFDTVRARGGALIVDEIYQGLVYAGSDQTVKEFTALELDPSIIVINSFSKYFGMTGWRLGWVVAPPELVGAMDKLAQNIFLAPPTLSQHAALAAFLPETRRILQARRDEFARRRDFLLPALEELGFGFSARPQGAFYLYGQCPPGVDDSFRFARELLEREAVAVTPGLDFGHNQPERHLRFAYTNSVEHLAEGVQRIRRFLHR